MGEITRAVQSWWQLASYCWDSPGAMVCASFWTHAVLAFVALGGLLVSIGLTKVVIYRRKLRRAYIAEWERNSVDEAGISEARWRGEEQPLADDPDMAAKIRAALDERKRQPAQ